MQIKWLARFWFHISRFSQVSLRGDRNPAGRFIPGIPCSASHGIGEGEWIHLSALSELRLVQFSYLIKLVTMREYLNSGS